ncbi:MAG: arsenate reductase ArsC [Acidobacteria bacterium]|nr:arsenate reductase ArsC [Acidobacteriota bacterium]
MPVKVLFLCTGNSCRSQMAEGLLRHYAGENVEVWSAGTEPEPVSRYAIRAMREIGIDISKQRSKSLESLAGREFDYVISVCDQARQSCPTYCGTGRTLHWSIPDPASFNGDVQETMLVFRNVRDGLDKRIREFVTEIQSPQRPRI